MTKYIGISGTHGTGKTTIAYNIATKLRMEGKNVVVVDEQARMCPFPINAKGTLDTQLWMISRQILDELERQDKFDVVICDRTLVDFYCYGMYSLEVNNPSEAHILRQFWAGMKSHISNKYSLVLIPDPQIFQFQINDGVRDMGIEFRESIHHRILAAYSEINVDAKQLRSHGYEDMIYDFIK